MGLFPFLPTFLACLVCLAGLETGPAGARAAPEPAAALLLLGLLLAEGGIRHARRARALPGRAVERAWKLFFGLYPPAAFAAAVFFLHLDGLPSLLGAERGGFPEKALLFAAYLALSNLNRLQRERYLHAAFRLPRRAAAFRLRTGFRTELTVGVLFFLFVFCGDLVEGWPAAARLLDALPLLSWGALFAALGVTAALLPRFVKLLWRLRPLEPGAHRAALLDFMDRIAFRVRDLLVWHTEGLVMNAAILGLRPRSRYILFTDLMVQRFTPEELTAVLAHEAGHGKHRHLSTYFLLSLSLLFLLSLAENFRTPFGGVREEVTDLLLVAAPLFVLYLVVVLGYLSRRFETEADVYGAAAVGDPERFIRVLEKVSAAAGAERTRSSWRHFSVERRVHLLRRFFFEAPEELSRFRRRMKRIRRGLLALFLVTAVLFTADLSLKTAAGAALLDMDRAGAAATAARLEAVLSIPGLGPSRWVLVPVLIEAGETDRAAALLRALAPGTGRATAPGPVRRLIVRVHRAYRAAGAEEKAEAWLRWARRTFPRDRALERYARLSRLPFARFSRAFEAWWNGTGGTGK